MFFGRIAGSWKLKDFGKLPAKIVFAEILAPVFFRFAFDERKISVENDFAFEFAAQAISSAGRRADDKRHRFIIGGGNDRHSPVGFRADEQSCADN